MITVKLPIRLVSEANVASHEHWRSRQRRAKSQRASAFVGMQAKTMLRAAVLLPMRIKITRIAPRSLDTDNLAASAKHTRDGIADWLGLDDGDPRLTWEYAQAKGAPREYAVEIEVEQLYSPGVVGRMTGKDRCG